VVSCSGVFRDLFINQMALLDRAVKLAAEADEPLEMNFVRKHALETAEELNVSLREAATRVFSNSAPIVEQVDAAPVPVLSCTEAL